MRPPTQGPDCAVNFTGCEKAKWRLSDSGHQGFWGLQGKAATRWRTHFLPNFMVTMLCVYLNFLRKSSASDYAAPVLVLFLAALPRLGVVSGSNLTSKGTVFLPLASCL
jgi:hypothetical protein